MGRRGYRSPVAAAKGPGRRAARRVPDDGSDRIKTVARNRRARHEYDILETYECGVALQGSEVKSLRAGRVTLADAYARVEGGRGVAARACTSPPTSTPRGSAPTTPSAGASCCLHRDQIDELMGQTQQKSLTLVPLSIYFKDGRAKVELALARGRRLYDKRHAIATRDAERDAAPRSPQRGGQERGPGGPQGIRLRGLIRDRRSATARAGGNMAEQHNQGVIGFDFGRQFGRSEPWSPEPR